MSDARVSMNLPLPKEAQIKTTNHPNGTKNEDVYLGERKLLDRTYSSESGFPVAVREYDSNGNLVRAMQEVDGDGYADSIYTATYDEQNRRTYLESKNGEGKTEFTQRTIYDEGPHSVKYITDNNGDGVEDSMDYSEYDDDGNLTFHGFMELGDSNSYYNSSEQYVYDVNGNKSGEAFYKGHNMESSSRYLNGQKLSTSYYDEEGKLSSREEFYYDDLGRPTGVGVDNRSERAWWDIFGLFVKNEPDGIVDYVIEYEN